MPGERPQDYEILDLLGEGGFAKVYRARCRITGQYIAMKKIDKALMSMKGMEGRVRQEVTIHSRLKHPSILELYTFFEDVNYVYLILELAHNRELARYFRHEPKGLDESLASDIFKQVVDGVLYLHSHHIIHRDLSLNNLLLTKDMKIKIADFGLATQLNEPDEKHMTMCGTPNYISPEVASRSNHGLPADVWGLGCLLYTLLTGKPPFDTHHIKQTLNRVIHAEYEMPLNISFEAQDLLERLLRKNPTERILLSQIIQHPFLYKSLGVHHSTELSRDSGFHTTLHTTHSSHQRTRSESRIKSSGHDLFRERCNSIDKIITKPSNQVLIGISSNTHRQSSVLSDTNESQNEVQKDGKNFSIETKENLTSGSRNIGVPPLCAARLPEVTHRTRNAELLISKDCSVMIKFIKKRGRHREDRITEICNISKDGMQVIIYSIDGGKGQPVNSPLSSHTPTPQEKFTYHDLPQKHWKKYLYAARFVDLVKAKTPKITFYTNRAKCHLMENIRDFEGNFYNGVKIINSANDGIKIVDQDGKSFHDLNNISSEMQDLYDHFCESMQRCMEVESLLHGLSENCFPLIMGRRPQFLNYNQKDQTSQQITPTMPPISSLNIGSFCHSSGVSHVNDHSHGREFNGSSKGSTIGQPKMYNPCGEPFKLNKPSFNKLTNNTNTDYSYEMRRHYSNLSKHDNG